MKSVVRSVSTERPESWRAAAPLRILHLFANYKWTGPAGPAIRTAVWQRRAGQDVGFAQAGWTLPGAEHRMALELFRAALPVVAGLELRKHFRPLSVRRDAGRLASRLAAEPVDVLHCHLLADHLIAALAVRRLAERPLLVRSLYDPAAPPRGWRERLCFARTDGVVVPTRAAAAGVAGQFGFDPARVLLQDPPIDSGERFDGADLRDRLGITADQFLIGITARIQPHRRFDLLWEVARRVVDARPEARFVLLGRGNVQDTRRLVEAPVARLGLTDHVRLPGYLYEPEYTRALRSLDAFLFLVPGSDGTCRAVREAMARGVPVVASRRGILPELLAAHPELPEFGPSGHAVEEDAASLAGALLGLIGDPVARARLSAAARARATGPMDPALATARLLTFYRKLRGEPVAGGGA